MVPLYYYHMKDLISISIGFAICGLFCDKALAWAREGHEAVAMIAEQLVSPATQAKVQDLLAKGGDRDLVSIASWADEVILAAHNEGPLRAWYLPRERM